jgi:hypothetical protein
VQALSCYPDKFMYAMQRREQVYLIGSLVWLLVALATLSSCHPFACG